MAGQRAILKTMLAAAVLAIAAAGTAAYVVLVRPNTTVDGQAHVITIPRGASFRVITDSLEQGGVLRHRMLFELAARITGRTKNLKAGRYKLASGLSNPELLADLAEGKSRVLLTVTIPEGWRYRDIAARFEEVLGVNRSAFTRLCEDTAFIRTMGVRGYTLEGYLMPDTYSFYFQPEPSEAVTEMVMSFKHFMRDSLAERVKASPMNLTEILALASIVEGETSVPSERARVAGVYLNRLKKRMRLEADPTVQYALDGAPRRLMYSDYKIQHDYNTYKIYGLPPGPINNPGRASIVAALYPEKHDYLYFVADGKGGHRFTKTFAEHKIAVRDYRRARRAARSGG